MKHRGALHQRSVRLAVLAAAVAAAIVSAWPGVTSASRLAAPERPMPSSTITVTQGSLMTLDDQGTPSNFCPLKHTEVQVEITGFLARTHVTQHFENAFNEKIEAVYTFPLPQRAAVDDMTLTVGDRIVKAKIKRREEAQAMYEAARTAGHVAGLLDQERPNIFTQSVANIMPGENVTITISYAETLTYEDGSYELVFPMVVGPRYIPGQPTGNQGGGWAPDTDRVPDASRITPPVVKEGTRAGHDISLEVVLDAGVPIESLASPSHAISVERPGADRAVVRLQNKAVIPNKDFILTYDVAGRKIEDAVLTHRNGQHGNAGFFTLILQPPDRVSPAEVMPKELVFVLDTSGSMSGVPIEKAKETMKLALEGLYPQDTFNLITFSGDTHILFPEPVPATKENLQKAQAFLQSRAGGGGTEMMMAIRAALDPSDAQNHVRIVCFMTDGYVGNDLEIIAEVQRHPNARVFSFGIGSSVNRFLLDKMAECGRGEVEYVGLKDDGSAAAKRFHERVRNPLLTDITVDWGRLTVADVYPSRLPDLFSAKPVVLTGRYTSAAKGVIRLRGKMAGRETTREIQVNLPGSEPRHQVLATLWARTRIDDLMGQDLNGLQRGTTRAEVREAITQLGLDYRLMTQFTSFVAVEEITITDGGQPRRIDVPVEIPEGVSYEGVFGRGDRGEADSRSGRLGALGGAPAASEPLRLFRENAIGKRGPVGSNQLPSFDSVEQQSGLSGELEGPRPNATKLHPALAAVAERLKNKRTIPTAEEAQFVKNGKAEIQVWLLDASSETLEQLKKLGFELLVQPKSAKLAIGRLPIDKLAALAELKAVRYVAPSRITS
ncbi:MAG: VIT and vWA domain-containing protein [Nitrospiraceae bacterium]